jgi:hypothetical protein
MNMAILLSGSWLMLVVPFRYVGLPRVESLTENGIDFRQSRRHRWLAQWGWWHDLHLDFDILPIGYAGIGVRFDRPAVDLSVQGLGHR